MERKKIFFGAIGWKTGIIFLAMLGLLSGMVCTRAEAGALTSLSLMVTGGTQMSPLFSPDKHKYRISVEHDIDEMTIKATVPEGAVLKIDDRLTDPEAGSSVKLNTGKNKLHLVVTLENGKTEEYLLLVMRENIQPVVEKFSAFSYVDVESGCVMDYRLYKPEGYTPGKEYPLVLYLHGSGEYGSGNQAQLLANQGAVVWAKPEEQAQHPCFVLAPQAQHSWVSDENAGEENPAVSDLEMVVKIIDRLEKNYTIDKARIYATGVSDGGTGIWRLNEEYPELFAAMVPVCGSGDVQQAEKLISKPVWMFHAEADPVIPVTDSRRMVEFLRENGGHPLYTEYPRAMYIHPMGHYSWIPAYQTKEMRDWLFEQRLKNKKS